MSATATWTPRRQGDLGEISAMQWLAGVADTVWIPLVGSPDVDLIAEIDGRLVKVQVKTSSSWRHGRWQVALCTRGGNQSWNGIIKLLDASRCDALCVHVGDGRRWYIPMEHVEGHSGILLGGPKYAQFEVARGHPLPSRGVP